MREFFASVALLLIAFGSLGLIWTGAGGGGGAESSFFDEFDSLDSARWTELTATSGSVTVSGGEIVIDDEGATDHGALIYHNTPIDWEKRNQYWMLVAGNNASGMPFKLHDGTPVLTTTGNANDIFEMNYASSSQYQIEILFPTPQHWFRSEPASSSWQTGAKTNSYPDVQIGDLHQVLFETRPNNGTPQVRVLMWDAERTDTQYGGNGASHRLLGFTDWISITSLSCWPSCADVYFVLGDGDTNAIDSNQTYEWVGWIQYDPKTANQNDLQDSQYAFLNSADDDGSFPLGYNVTLYYTLANVSDTTSEMQWYVPWDRDETGSDDTSGIVLARGSQPASTIDDAWVARPDVVYMTTDAVEPDGYYMVYDCREPGSGDNQVCGAYATAPEGPWTPNTNNPILSIADDAQAGVDADWKFARLFYDASDTGVEWKIFVNNEGSGTDITGEGIYVSESGTFDSNVAGAWSTPTEVLPVGAAGSTWDHKFVSQPTWWNITQTGSLIFYAGLDGTGAGPSKWQIGCAEPSDDSDPYSAQTYTKCSGNPLITADNSPAIDAAVTPISTTTGLSVGNFIRVPDGDGPLFTVGEWINVQSAQDLFGSGSSYIGRIKAIDNSGDPDLLEMWTAFGGLASGLEIQTYYGESVAVTALRQEGTMVRLYGTAFRLGPNGEESTIVFETTSDSDLSDNTWTPVAEPWGIPMTLERPDRSFLNENPTFIKGEI
jgi:hypothetical protein